jgi:hypothetical protein
MLTRASRTLPLSALLLASAWLALPPIAAAGVDVIVDLAPPPAKIVARAPPPRPGHVYVPGYWSWDNGHYVWTEETWVEERPGFRYAPPTWVPEEKRYRFVPGHWEQTN